MCRDIGFLSDTFTDNILICLKSYKVSLFPQRRLITNLIILKIKGLIKHNVVLDLKNPFLQKHLAENRKLRFLSCLSDHRDVYLDRVTFSLQ